MIGITSALARAADLTRPYPHSRTKRVSISVEASRVVVAATNGSVGAIFTCYGDDLACTDEGLYSARGCDFPKLSTGHWVLTSHETDLACTSVTSKGHETNATRKRSRVVSLEKGHAGAVSLGMIQGVVDVSTGYPEEFAVVSRGEIASALAVLDAGAAVEFDAVRRGVGWWLDIVAGPFRFQPALAGGPRTTELVGRCFHVRALDTALELLEGFEAELTWRFPKNPRALVVISSACGSVVVGVAPLAPPEVPHGH